MADLEARLAKVYCRGVDLSTALQSLTLEQLREETDGTVFASDIRTQVPTLAKVSLAFAGLYSDGANTFGEVQRQAFAADDEPVTIMPQGTTGGNRAFIVLAHRSPVKLLESVTPAGLHKGSLSASSRSGLGDGVVAYVGSVGDDAVTVARQVGAVAAGQTVRATVHILGVTGTPSIVFSLESDNAEAFSSATTQDTSASQTTRGSTLLEASGPITDDWWRVRLNHSGTGSFTVAIAIAVATE